MRQRHRQPATARDDRDGASDLALFWAGVIASRSCVYVILDGFDLGVGILFGTTRDEDERGQMMTAIAPFWDGNETWLVVIGAGLFAAFPVVYAVFLGAFYIPVLLLLFGLIFRGVAFEFRYRSARHALAVGLGVLHRLHRRRLRAGRRGRRDDARHPGGNGQYAGGAFDGCAPFPLLTGVGLVLGYALLGAGWLVLKCEGALREWAYARIPWLAASLSLVRAGLAVVLAVDRAHRASHLGERRWGLVVSRARRRGAGWRRAAASRRRRDGVPFAMTVLFFLAAFLTLGGDVLAVHDPVPDHRGQRRGARRLAAVPVLGRGRGGAAGDRRLHARVVLDVPRQAAQPAVRWRLARKEEEMRGDAAVIEALNES